HSYHSTAPCGIVPAGRARSSAFDIAGRAAHHERHPVRRSSTAPEGQLRVTLIRPFAGLRVRPDAASRVAAPPYDVMNTEEARRMAAGNPDSFLHVSRPEIDLPAGTDIHADAVY